MFDVSAKWSKSDKKIEYLTFRLKSPQTNNDSPIVVFRDITTLTGDNVTVRTLLDRMLRFCTKIPEEM